LIREHALDGVLEAAHARLPEQRSNIVTWSNT